MGIASARSSTSWIRAASVPVRGARSVLWYCSRNPSSLWFCLTSAGGIILLRRIVLVLWCVASPIHFLISSIPSGSVLVPSVTPACIVVVGAIAVVLVPIAIVVLLLRRILILSKLLLGLLVALCWNRSLACGSVVWALILRRRLIVALVVGHVDAVLESADGISARDGAFKLHECVPSTTCQRSLFRIGGMVGVK